MKASFARAWPGKPTPATCPSEAGDQENFLILATDRDNFAISDLNSFYFLGRERDSEHLQGFVYTDRPVYRPNQEVFFKGILRGFDETE